MLKRDRDITPPSSPTESTHTKFLQEQLKQAHTAASKLFEDNAKKDLALKELKAANKKLKTELDQTKTELDAARLDLVFADMDNNSLWEDLGLGNLDWSWVEMPLEKPSPVVNHSKTPEELLFGN